MVSLGLVTLATLLVGVPLGLRYNDTEMTDEDVQKTARLLRQLAPGFLPYPIFEQVARLVALPIVEFIPLRRSVTGDVEVLLIERGNDDPLWPGTLHTPGTVVRATDVHKGRQDGWAVFARILHDELHDTPVGEPHYVGSMFHDSRRGAEQAQLYWVEVKGEPRVGEFYNAESLPETLMASQVDFIRQAVEDFKRHVL